jgi:hypothetical protein
MALGPPCPMSFAAAPVLAHSATSIRTWSPSSDRPGKRTEARELKIKGRALRSAWSASAERDESIGCLAVFERKGLRRRAIDIDLWPPWRGMAGGASAR